MFDKGRSDNTLPSCSWLIKGGHIDVAKTDGHNVLLIWVTRTCCETCASLELGKRYVRLRKR